jgi:hypothetical protein
METTEIAEKWLAYTVERLLKAIDKKKIRDTNRLFTSVIGELQAEAGGDVAKMVLSYLAYGRFVDMGVGNGISLSEAIQGKRSRKRNWYSKTIYAQFQKLSEIMLENYADKGLDIALRSLPQIVEM